MFGRIGESYRVVADVKRGINSRVFEVRPSRKTLTVISETLYRSELMATYPLPVQPASTSSLSNNLSAATTPATSTAQNIDDGSRKKATKRRKVSHACLYCRRSHMTCDEGRPCQRWYASPSYTNTLVKHSVLSIKREIGHLCRDDRGPKVTDKQPSSTSVSVDMSHSFAPGRYRKII